MRQFLRTVNVRLRQVLGSSESPARLAAAWALGVGIGFSPLVGLHTGLALLLAFVFRLNRVDVVLGTLVINPWTMVIYIPTAVVLGSWITGTPLSFGEVSGSLGSIPFWKMATGRAGSLAVSWLVGGFTCSLLAGAVTFAGVFRVVRWRRRRRTLTSIHQVALPDAGSTRSSPSVPPQAEPVEPIPDGSGPR